MTKTITKQQRKVKNKSKIVKSTDRFSRSNCSKMLNSSINVLLQK